MQTPNLGDFVSDAACMQQFMRLVHKVSKGESSLLILGETGVGKERLARAIHAESARAEMPFIAINCAAMPENLLESELFGHEQGAFTGAARAHRGCFELAHRGTLLLDEIGELPYHLQVKLLRALQERYIQRLGGEKPIPVDVRIMAATNIDLEEAVATRQFRQDLFFRLSVVSLTIPPLRDRPEDIAPLAHRYLDYLERTLTLGITGIREETLEALRRYAWPGNIRELANVLERAMLIADNELLSLDDLPVVISSLVASSVHARPPGGANGYPESWVDLPWKDVRQAALDEVERWYFTRLLERTAGKINATAEHAGIDVRSVNDKMRKYELDKKEFRKREGGIPAPAQPAK